MTTCPDCKSLGVGLRVLPGRAAFVFSMEPRSMLSMISDFAKENKGLAIYK